MTSSPTAVGLAPFAGRTSFFFRTNYYSSLGFAKEAAKAYSLAGLDLLLEKSPIDIEQLRHFCLHCSDRLENRPLLWRILLGALPPYKETWPYVEEQQAEEWDVLFRAVRASQLDKIAEADTRRHLEALPLASRPPDHLVSRASMLRGIIIICNGCGGAVVSRCWWNVFFPTGTVLSTETA